MNVEAQVAAVKMKTMGLIEEAMPGAPVEQVRKVFDNVPEFMQLAIKLTMKQVHPDKASAIFKVYCILKGVSRDELLVLLKLMPTVLTMIDAIEE
jgi:hypothetical protein